MSTTDDALAWLLSLNAACTSSPAFPDFTDWLHISPTTASPSSDHLLFSPPFQDVSASSRVNLPSPEPFALNYLYDFSDYFASDGTHGLSESGRFHNDITFDTGLIPTSVQPVIFSQHNRMLSLESMSATSTTLINTPSPRSPSGSLTPPELAIKSPFSPPNSLVCSPATKLIQELHHLSSFGTYYDLTASSEVGPSIFDFSPVIRAEKAHEYLLSEKEQPTSKSRKKKRREKKSRKLSLFEDRLRASVPTRDGDIVAALCQGTPTVTLGVIPTTIDTLVPPASHPSVPQLLSPCKLVLTGPITSEAVIDIPLPVELPTIGKEYSEQVDFSTSPRPTHDLDVLSPLTPLTPLSSSSGAGPPLKIVLKLKRKLPLTADISTPVRRSKRPRRCVVVAPVEPPSSPKDTANQWSSPEYIPAEQQNLVPAFSKRTLPADIEVSENFPLFYRRFPASSYYQAGVTESPCTLFDVPHPGGNYNPPRAPLDLYTPRFVKGKGAEKLGLCPICLESPERGGEKRKVWLAMKFSAFKWVLCSITFLCANVFLSYHMQYAHGISASTGRPFSPPIAFRIVPRPNPGKKEKRSIQQGKCHKCTKWVVVEGIKDMESKVKELHWWKHAAACHHDSSLQGEGDFYETDAVLAQLLALQAEGDV